MFVPTKSFDIPEALNNIHTFVRQLHTSLLLPSHWENLNNLQVTAYLTWIRCYLDITSKSLIMSISGFFLYRNVWKCLRNLIVSQSVSNALSFYRSQIVLCRSKILGWLKRFGPAQNILRPVKGQGKSVSKCLKCLKVSQKSQSASKFLNMSQSTIKPKHGMKWFWYLGPCVTPWLQAPDHYFIKHHHSSGSVITENAW